MNSTMERIYGFLGPRDPKMAAYPFMDTPITTVLLSSIYLVYVLYLGPHWMRNRKPYELRIPMFIYNMSLVVLSSWLVINYIIHGWSRYNFRCEPVDLSDSENARKLTQICFVFFVSKIIEYCDTVFFILRKKDSQINFLHVFHHSSVPVTGWFGVSYGPSGYNLIFPTVNSFVHVWMYLYYGLSALGPGIQKYLWWKKYLTKLQLAQFMFVQGYFLQLYLFPKEDCPVSPFLFYLSLVQAFIYFMLFMNFYLRSYQGKPKKTPGINRKHDNSVEHQNGKKHYADTRKLQ